MANVKITELTELAAADVAADDVLPIVDVGADSTKKVKISSLIVSIANANDFVTFTQLNSNLNIVSANSAAVEVRRAANTTAFTNEDTALQARLTTNVNALTTSINTLDANADAIEARRVANVTVRDDEDTAIQARLTTNVNALTTEDTALQARLTTNVNALTTSINTLDANADAIEARRVANVTVRDDEDTALQARLTTNVNALTTSINTLDANADAIEARRVANVTVTSTEDAAIEARRVANIAGAVSSITTADLTASRALVSDGSGKVAVSAVTSTEIGHLDGVSSAIQTQINAVEARRAANLTSATFTGEVNMSDDLIVTGNLTVNGDTTTVNSENKVIQDRFIMLANSVSGAPSADVGILFNRGTSGNAALFYDESAKFFTLSETRDPDTNVAISPTGAANLAVGQFTAATVAFDGADLNTAITDNVSTLNTSIAAVETRRTNNIAGAISTVLTSDLTASRALVSDGSGKVAVSAVTATEIGHLDGVTSAIQTQFTGAETRRTNNIAGAISTVLTSDLTADRIMITNGSGKIAASSGVTPTELGMIDGITLGTTAASKAVTSDANGDTNFTADVDIDGNLVIGTNTSNTLTIVGSVDLGTL